MSRIDRQNIFQFLNQEGLLPRYLHIFDLFILRQINVQFCKCYFELKFLSDYGRSFGTSQGFRSLIKVLLSQNLNSELKDSAHLSYNLSEKKIGFELLQFMPSSSFMQHMLMKAIRERRKGGQSLNNWQIIAFTALLSSANFITLRSTEKDFSIISFLNAQQKVFFIKSLLELFAKQPSYNCRYSEENITENTNFIILTCIKRRINHLLELLLRINIGLCYKDECLLTEPDSKGQHPLLACFDSNNQEAFQLFLTYAEHFFRIYHKFSGAPNSSPPMSYAALKRQSLFIEVVAQQKPEVFDQLNICDSNIAHSALSLYPDYRHPELRKIILALYKSRPSLFFVKNISQKTPLDLLPKEFFTDSQFDFPKIS